MSLSVIWLTPILLSINNSNYQIIMKKIYRFAFLIEDLIYKQLGLTPKCVG